MQRVCAQCGGSHQNMKEPINDYSLKRLFPLLDKENILQRSNDIAKQNNKNYAAVVCLHNAHEYAKNMQFRAADVCITAAQLQSQTLPSSMDSLKINVMEYMLQHNTVLPFNNKTLHGMKVLNIFQEFYKTKTLNHQFTQSVIDFAKGEFRGSRCFPWASNALDIAHEISATENTVQYAEICAYLGFTRIHLGYTTTGKALAKQGFSKWLQNPNLPLETVPVLLDAIKRTLTAYAFAPEMEPLHRTKSVTVLQNEIENLMKLDDELNLINELKSLHANLQKYVKIVRAIPEILSTFKQDIIQAATFGAEAGARAKELQETLLCD